MHQHIIGPWWMSRNIFIFFLEYAEKFMYKLWLSAGNRRQNFLWILSHKGVPFRSKICGKSKLSMDYTTESFDFPQIILRKGVPFHCIILGKSNFPLIMHGKFPLFHGYLSQIKTKTQYIFRRSSENNRDQKVSCYSPYKQIFYNL
jgi:hypothetical protein